MTVQRQFPLKGILVADFSRVLAGPLCSQFLADAGARVIKVEEPDRGDETRRWGPPFIKGISAYFLAVNRGKESIAVDLKTRRGAEAARLLVRRADVVLDNFLPRQREKLLPKVPSGAVHCTISGFDSDSAERDMPGYDLLAQAESGWMSITGDPDGDPMKSGVALADVLTAHFAFGAIAAALVRRERTGRGARLEISLFGAAMASLINVAQNVLVTKREAGRYGNAHPSIVPYQLFHAIDRPFVLGVGTDRHFHLLCTEVLHRRGLATDARFLTNRRRVKNRDALIEILTVEFRRHHARRWISRCRRAGVPAAMVRGVREALRTAAGKSMRGTVSHPLLGVYEALRNPLRIDGVQCGTGSAPPGLGDQTASILAELGLKE